MLTTAQTGHSGPAPARQLAATSLEDRPYYGIAEAARLLGINRVTLWRWISAGRVPVWRVGPRTARIRREDLQNLLVRADRPDNPGNGRATPAGEHFVHFYESDDFIAEAVADFLGAGLRDGEAAVVIAEEAHRRAIDARLRDAGHDLDGATTAGRFVLLDAAATLRRFMKKGAPDPERFAAVIGSVLARAGAGGTRPVRAFGEMVALLVREGNPTAAIQLERMWNDLQHSHAFSLMCAYPMAQLSGAGFADLIGEVCDVHSHSVPAESYAGLRLEEDRARAIAALQQKAATLEAEIAQRLRAERVLRDYLETATIGMHWVGPDGTVLWANQAELDLLGYARDEYVGQHISAFHADRAEIEDMLARLASGETLRDYPARLRRKDGTLRDVLIDSSVLWEDGRFVHTRCFTRDVTEVRRLEQERATLLERERAARAAAERAAERDRRLQEITGQLSRSLDPAEVLASIARSAADLLDAPVGAVFLLDRETSGGDFSLAAAHGIDAARIPDLRLPRHASLAG
ncbi:MAG TPA: MEDS domain-containing protein, partial [Chloroflexota bacterium]|nr:MEDS domain-containing protein [Chloroflexota bacterium]